MERGYSPVAVSIAEIGIDVETRANQDWQPSGAIT